MALPEPSRTTTTVARATDRPATTSSTTSPVPLSTHSPLGDGKEYYSNANRVMDEADRRMETLHRYRRLLRLPADHFGRIEQLQQLRTQPRQPVPQTEGRRPQQSRIGSAPTLRRLHASLRESTTAFVLSAFPPTMSSAPRAMAPCAARVISTTICRRSRISALSANRPLASVSMRSTHSTLLVTATRISASPIHFLVMSLCKALVLRSATCSSL